MQIEHFVLMNELLGRRDALGRIATGIFLNDLEPAAVDSALIVDMPEICDQTDLCLAVARCVA